MYSKEKLLELVGSDKPSVRCEAIKYIYKSQESCPEYIYALQNATQDLDPEIALRARIALGTPVHHKMMIQMGLVKLSPAKIADPSPGGPVDTAVQTAYPAQPDIEPMLKDIRDWGYSCIAIAVLQLLPLRLYNAPGSILLILVGLSSFIFKSSSIYIIYAVVLLWDTIVTFIGAPLFWLIFGLVQVFMVAGIIRSFLRYRKVEANYYETSSSTTVKNDYRKREAGLFPWIGSILGCTSLVGFLLLFAIGIILPVSKNDSSIAYNVNLLVVSLMLNIGILGLAFGLVTLLFKYRPIILGIIGMIAGMSTILVYFGMIFAANSG